MDNPCEKAVLQNSNQSCQMLLEIFLIGHDWKFIQQFPFKWQLLEADCIEISCLGFKACPFGLWEKMDSLV